MNRTPSRTGSSVAPPDDYLKLVRKFPLRPIRTVDDYDRAGAMLDTLVGREGEMSAGESDYLDTLTLLVERSDDDHPENEISCPVPELLKALMEQRGMNVTALGAVIGSKGVASEILRGRRAPSTVQIFKLAEFFKVLPADLLRDPRERRPQRTRAAAAKTR